MKWKENIDIITVVKGQENAWMWPDVEMFSSVCKWSLYFLLCDKNIKLCYHGLSIYHVGLQYLLHTEGVRP